jgi:hypothetical protein
MKTFNRFNESMGDECSFEDFKNIMFDIFDDFDFECDFREEKSIKSFECEIDMCGLDKYRLHDDIPSLNIDFLDWHGDQTLPGFDNGYEINEEILDSAIDSIDSNIDSLKELQSELESIIKYQEECKEVFERLKKIRYRFEDFSNFDYCEIGFERGIFLITFGYK